MTLAITLSVLLICVSWVAYVFIVYPVLVRILARVFGSRPSVGAALPHVAVVVSAFNEATCIQEKLDNCSELRYPPDRLLIVVSSDGSTDGTNEIVERYDRMSSRIELQAYAENRGKTAALCETVRRLPPEIEIVVFSDANALYHPDAIEKLVRNFADKSVGCVCGELRYRTPTGEAAFRSWENRIREAQSALGIPPSAEGSIFSIRRDLMPDELPVSVMEDLVLPYRIAAGGWRVVWEPEAVSVEPFNLNMPKRMARRRRIVNRAIRALPHIPFAWNPTQSGWVAFHFVSHRVLRWFAPFALLLGWLSALLIGVAEARLLWISLIAVGAAGFIILSLLFRTNAPFRWRLIALPTDFVVANAAMFFGVVSALTGRRIERWIPSR